MTPSPHLKPGGSPYREPAERPAETEPVNGPPDLEVCDCSRCGGVSTKHARLIRARGCRCKPPGWLWCWLFDVAEHDVWACAHGRKWTRSVHGTWWTWLLVVKVTNGQPLR